jgi:hypothetical protein
MDDSKASLAPQCPWCPETRPTLKQLLMHMEAAHHRRWCDLALTDTNQTSVVLIDL